LKKKRLLYSALVRKKPEKGSLKNSNSKKIPIPKIHKIVPCHAWMLSVVSFLQQEVQIPFNVSSCEISGEQGDIGIDFSPVRLHFSLHIYSDM
jgi:Ni,Fe-hydrogenase maturation factor